jgi:hypothetical protein
MSNFRIQKSPLPGGRICCTQSMACRSWPCGHTPRGSPRSPRSTDEAEHRLEGRGCTVEVHTEARPPGLSIICPCDASHSAGSGGRLSSALRLRRLLRPDRSIDLHHQPVRPRDADGSSRGRRAAIEAMPVLPLPSPCRRKFKAKVAPMDTQLDTQLSRPTFAWFRAGSNMRGVSVPITVPVANAAAAPIRTCV